MEQFVIGLVDALSRLADGDEEYLILHYSDPDNWIKPYVSGACRMVYVTAAARPPGWSPLLRKTPALRTASRFVKPFFRRLGGNGRRLDLLSPTSNSTLRRVGADLIHFTTQNAFLTEVPSIYQAWDLQHLHLPEFFTSGEAEDREISYRAFCDQAKMVVAASTWTQRDIMHHYGLSEDKVRIIPPGPVLSAYPTPTQKDLEATRRKFALPDVFVFYPAKTFPHKNHIGLVEAIAHLRDTVGIRIHLVSSGRLNGFYAEIQKKISELDLDAQVQFLGFVPPLELQCLYRLCRYMVYPTKFEGFGMPILEAFLANVPIACSNVTSLPELAHEAALVFDPYSLEEIAEALKCLWTDDALRRTLVKRGQLRMRDFSWPKSARTFRAHYRAIANRPLNDEDRALLVEKMPI